MSLEELEKSLGEASGAVTSRIDRDAETIRRMTNALKSVLAAHAAGELSYRTSAGCGYEALLEARWAIEGLDHADRLDGR